MAAIITIPDDKRKELDILIAKLGLSSYADTLDFVLKLLRVIAEWTEQTKSQHSFTPDQEKKLGLWIQEHNKTCSIREEQAAIGGRFTTHFIPTGLGIVERVSCACGAIVDLTDYDGW